jgi:Leucine-rich repeat (LRR) protein
MKIWWLFFMLGFCCKTACPLGYNCISNKFRIPIEQSKWRIIYSFNCEPTTSPNPIFQVVNGSSLIEYNEVDLSPNVFTAVPVNQLCDFKYTYLVDLSFNKLNSFDSTFITLKCLSYLKNLDLSNNFISTALTADIFDDQLASQIQSLNLSFNQIPSVETALFIRANNTARFPHLTYLGLAKNSLKEFDLLWPLALPSPRLKVDLKLNRIEKLINQLNKSFKDKLFQYDMTGDRHLDATTNSLQTFSDDNLLIYGIQSAKDFRAFLNKISNYDFRQSNLARVFICYCPPSGLFTVTWYKAFSHMIDLNRPIYQLYCSGSATNINVFNFSCHDVCKNSSK